MSAISGRTNVYLWSYHPPHSGQRVWVAGTETILNKLGEKVLKPLLDDDPHIAQSFRYDIGIILKRRLESEGCISPLLYSFHFSLSPTGEEVAAGNVTSAPTEDNREIMHYRGLLVRPGRDVNLGRCWYVKFPGTTIESVRGDSPEDAVNKTFERNLQDKAEKYEVPPEPVVPPATNNYNGHRVRPGSLRDEVRQR